MIRGKTIKKNKLLTLILTVTLTTSGIVSTGGVPGTITKDFLLAPENVSSGYGIIYKTCCGYGYLRFDENGTKLIKDIINKSNKTSNIEVIVQGTRNEDTIHVTSVTEAYDQTYSRRL